MYCDAVTMSISWGTIVAGVNDRLYVEQTIVGQTTAPIATIVLASGTYNAQTLRTELENKLNASRHAQIQAYTVTLANSQLLIANASNPSTEGKVRILTPADRAFLETNVPGFPGAFANELIGHHRNSTSDPYIYSGNLLFCQHVDLQLHKQVFLHAPGLGESSTMDLLGNTDILRRVILGNSQSGETVNDALQTGLSYVNFSSDTVLTTMRFQVKSFDGSLVTMQDHEIGFELIIERPGEKSKTLGIQ